MIEIVYTWQDGREEVRYRRVAGTPEAANLIDQVERLRARDGEASPYSWRNTSENEDKTSMNTKAATWFADAREFRQLCGDAQSQASSEKSQEFAAQMMLAANQHGLDTYISEPQLKWLCDLADWDMPRRLEQPQQRRARS